MFDLNTIKLSPILSAFGFGASSSSLGGRTGSKFMRFAFPSSYTERTDGNYKIIRFDASQTIRVINYAFSPADNAVDLFIVAGGGNGGGNGISGGGGGAGGIIDYPGFNIASIPYSIPLTIGGTGSPSNFGGLTSIGGGGGGSGGSPSGNPGSPGGSGGGGGGCSGYRCGGGGGGTGWQKTQPNPFGISGDSITYGWGFNGSGAPGPSGRKYAGGGGGAGGNGSQGSPSSSGGGGSGRNLPNPLGGPGNPFPQWSSGQYSKGGNGGQPANNQEPILNGDGGGSGQPGTIFMRYKFK